MRWGENETHKFVKIYLSHDLLWNPENEAYNLKSRRQIACKQLAAQFKAATNISLNERETKRKIKNLRATYAQELIKIKRRSTPTSTFRPTIKWFADFHRCFKDIQGKRGKVDTSCDEQPEGDDAQKVWLPDDDDDDADCNDDEEPKDPITSTPDDNYILLLKTEPDDTKSPEIETHNVVKTRKRKYNPSANQPEQSFVSVDSTSGEDEFDIYGKYIASQLRRMGLERALRVQLQIQSIVSEARIDHLTENQ